MLGVRCRSVVDTTPFRAPKGKLPWIDHEWHRIGDSGFIIEYLTHRFGRDPHAALSGSERRVAAAFPRLRREPAW